MVASGFLGRFRAYLGSFSVYLEIVSGLVRVGLVIGSMFLRVLLKFYAVLRVCSLWIENKHRECLNKHVSKGGFVTVGEREQCP